MIRTLDATVEISGFAKDFATLIFAQLVSEE